MWSVKSGKTRLFFNGDDISDLFKDRRRKNSSTVVEFKWKTFNGIKLVVSAHASYPSGSRQYECKINGASYFTLPSRSEVEPKLSGSNKNRQSRQMSSFELSSRSTSAGSGDRQSEVDSASAAEMQQVQHRLAAAGFKNYQFDMEDELRSELYSSTLDILRDEVAASVPETEEMMSRAIIAAFSEDHDSSDTSHDSFSEQSERLPMDAPEVEADVLGEAYEWSKWSHKFVNQADLHDRRLEFMQRHVETMVSHVRHERLSPHAASKIMLRLAMLLQLDVSREPEKDTVVLLGIPKYTSVQHILDIMHPFGEVDVAAVSKRHEGFGKQCLYFYANGFHACPSPFLAGICRFLSEPAAMRACEAALRKELSSQGVAVEAYDLYSVPVMDGATGRKASTPLSNGYADHGDDDDSLRHFIDPSDDAIEAMYRSRQTRSSSMSDFSVRNKFSSHESTQPSEILRNQFKHMSTGTVSTMSLDMDDCDSNSKSFVYMSAYE